MPQQYDNSPLSPLVNVVMLQGLPTPTTKQLSSPSPQRTPFAASFHGPLPHNTRSDSSVKLSINPLLGSMYLDVTRPPQSRSYQVPSEFFEPATNPPTQSIILASPDLHWEISVRSPFSHVTILDLLGVIYRSMCKQIRPDEFSQCPNKDEIAASFYERIDRIRSSQERDQAHARGVCRMDSLCGKTWVRFTGPLYEGMKGLTMEVGFRRS